MARPKLFTIAPHAPFLPTLVARIADGTLPGPAASPFGLADLTILVPTRRARTALANAFLDAFGPALLLPDIRALGDTDAAELPFLPPYEAEGLPHPVGASERRLVLASLVAKWAETAERAAADASGFTSPPSPGEILSLAESLGTLIDACHTEGVPAARFRELAKDTELSAHWQRSLDFLDIALRFWPLHLAESGSADAAEVRDKALDRLTAAVPALFGSRPVIAAGSTGSVPATARLMAAIARLPNGALVLPGLDTDLDGVAHETLITAAAAPHGHPQYGLARLLEHLGAGIGEVEELAGAPSPRTKLVRRAMALPNWTGAWATSRALEDADAALDGVSVLAARNEDEEARAIALRTRDAVRAGQTVGIVTPDRTLARRIAAELRRFGITVDDAAGTPLFQSRAGRLMRSAIALVADGWAPVALMALLRNRHVTLGLDRLEVGRLADLLELGLLRGQRLGSGAAGLRTALQAARAKKLDHPAIRLTDDQCAALDALVDRLEAALAPVARLIEGSGFSAADLALALRTSFAALTGVGGSEPASPEGGAEFLAWTDEMIGLPGLGPVFAGRHLDEAFAGLVGGKSVRAPAPETVGVSLFGLLEARLLRFDLTILAGLNEGVWPAAADPGPWLSRNMAIAIGLEPEERRQGQAAHDFEMALGAPEVVLALAERIGTSPALPSRLLQRLETYAGAAAAAAMRERGEKVLVAARALDAVTGQVPARRPTPTPPAALRPRGFSVTEIEKLIRSPYELYARYVLGLMKLAPLGADPDLAERGSLIHRVMEAMVDKKIDPMSPDALDQLLAEAETVFAGLETQPARRAIWTRRLKTQGARVLEFEARRAGSVAERHVEITGRWRFPVEGVEFDLRGRADRIDLKTDGSYEIIDFKTGSVPAPKDMKALLAPQLLAEARMLAEGGFAGEGLAAAPVSALTYLRLPADPTGFEEKPFLTPDDKTIAEAADDLFVELQSRIATFLLSDDVAMAPDILPKANRTYEGDYDHLARRAEWAAEEDAEGE